MLHKTIMRSDVSYIDSILVFQTSFRNPILIIGARETTLHQNVFLGFISRWDIGADLCESCKRLYSGYNASCCPGEARDQGIYSHVIDFV